MVAERVPRRTVFPRTLGIAIERGLPEGIGENGGSRCVRAVVTHVEQAAERGMKTHHIEIRATDNTGANFARLAEADHGETDDGEIAEFFDGFDIGLDVLNFRNGEVGVVDADTLGTLADIDDAVFVAIVERAKEDAADDAKDGSVGADAERESDDDGDRETFTAPQGAGCEL